jgi:hypothetical protein
MLLEEKLCLVEICDSAVFDIGLDIVVDVARLRLLLNLDVMSLVVCHDGDVCLSRGGDDFREEYLPAISKKKTNSDKEPF